MDVVLPASLRTLSNGAFAECERLETVKFEDVPKECSDTDDDCRIAIPAGVEQICPCAFQNCQAFSEVVFEEGSVLEKLSSSCFRECAIETIALPSTVRSIGKTAFDTRAFQTVVVPEGCAVEE